MNFNIQGSVWQADENVVLLEQTGSFAHGTSIPPENGGIDDIDAMGVVLPTRRYFIGLSEWGSRGTKEVKRPPLDIVLYDLRKFVGLLLNGNPNVLCMLFPPEDCVLFKSEVGDILLSMRPHFIAKSIHFSFKGYAIAQLKKMYATEGAFQGYMGEKRKKLVMKHGYDTKNAAHLIRLLELDIEVLSTGYMQVRRPNAEHLKAIKRGEIPLADLRAYSEGLFQKCDEAFVNSPLREKPNHEAVEALLVDVLGRHCANNTSPFNREHI